MWKVKKFETNYGTEYLCAKCGGEVDWIVCDDCEDGLSHHDCGEDICCCKYPENNVICTTCEGEAGWWYCPRCDGEKSDS